MHYFIIKYQIVTISFYLSEKSVDQFPYTNLLSNFRHFNSFCNIQRQQEIHQSKYNYLIRLDH